MMNLPLHIVQKLREVVSHRTIKLDLSYSWGASNDKKMVRIPDEVSRYFPYLEELNLANNNLTSISYFLSRLTNLRALDLSYNRLESLPKEISQLKDLTSLCLAGNQIQSIDESVVHLTSLRSLVLGGNKIETLPETISQLESIVELNLHNNALSSLPQSFSKLQNLKHLSLGNNKFDHIPEVIYELTALESLEFSNDYHIDNKNQIKEVSSLVVNLTNLTKVSLDNNPVEKPPPEVVARGVNEIKNYFQQLEREGVDYLYEAKLLIVGESGAGKTTLARKIENTEYTLQENEKSTEGIEIIQWCFPIENGQIFRVNIWDFGGQEIYHATHQFFLTKRSLYALVADTRKEDTDFYYWLNIVELLSNNSPLLIIKNEKQDRIREINERQLRGQFASLKETLATNLATNRGLAEIINEIKHYIRNLPHIGTPLPKTWVKVREALERDVRNYISTDEYLHICLQNGFMELKDKLQLSGYLHDLGVCLHFQEDALLKRTVILKPKWGTDAVYTVLDNPTVISNLGKFDQNDLKNIWWEDQYAEMQDELLQLMINFKLCYKIPSTKFYIAPQLLTENQPHYDWEQTDNSILRYTYEFMPKGIITQFIVVMHTMIAEQSYVWRSGVILEREGTKAEIVEHYGKREIKIRIAGMYKNELMTIVSYEFDKIHKTYQGLRYSKLIPCNCPPCKNTQEPHFYPYEILRQFMTDKEERIQCQRSYRMVEVKQLINDITGVNEETTSETLIAPVRDQVFVSYSHLDKEWANKLQVMLKPLTRNKSLVLWSDDDIRPGTLWRQEIERALSAAKVAVLLVSPNFLASNFIAEHELPPLLETAAKGGLKIIWVAVSHSLYGETNIANYQAANNPEHPLDSLQPNQVNRDLVKISHLIKAAANE